MLQLKVRIRTVSQCNRSRSATQCNRKRRSATHDNMVRCKNKKCNIVATTAPFCRQSWRILITWAAYIYTRHTLLYLHPPHQPHPFNACISEHPPLQLMSKQILAKLVSSFITCVHKINLESFHGFIISIQVFRAFSSWSSTSSWISSSQPCSTSTNATRSHQMGERSEH